MGIPPIGDMVYACRWERKAMSSCRRPSCFASSPRRSKASEHMGGAAEDLLRGPNVRAGRKKPCLGRRGVDSLLRAAPRVFKTILLFVDGGAGIVYHMGCVICDRDILLGETPSIEKTKERKVGTSSKVLRAPSGS